MSEMAAYILANIQTSDRAIRTLERRFGVLTLALITYIVMQNKKLRKLSDELKEMKHEGE